MPRSIWINGETLVQVKGAEFSALGDPAQKNHPPILWELGLAEKEVTIEFQTKYAEIKADDFGPDVPANLMSVLSTATIDMTLVHYDRWVLDSCIAESMGGSTLTATYPQKVLPGTLAGTFLGAGTLMGTRGDPQASGNHWISLNLTSPNINYPWHFPTTYLEGPPLEIPLGTKRSLVKLRWRALPYAGLSAHYSSVAIGAGGNQKEELKSAGATLFDHTLDT